MRDFVDFLRDLVDAVLAVPAAFLPARYWPRLPQLPIERLALVSGLATLFAGAAVGIVGFFDYTMRVGDAAARLVIKVAEEQNAGRLPQDPALNVAPLAASLLAPLAFMLFTPMGWLACYLTISAFARLLMYFLGERMGDPVLTGVDAVISRTWRRQSAASARRAREREEGEAVPDRLYTGEAAGLAGVDFVVVASRRKAEWEEGAFVLTEDKWYRLGAPFDVRLPQGLRTVYPLTEITTLDVLRRGVPYQLPRLSRAPLRLDSLRS